MKKTSRSYNQHKLKIICDRLCDDIEHLLSVLGVDCLKPNGKMLVGSCPIHEGDNITALNLYPTGEHYRGNWKCRTHNCDKFFKGSIIGFIRGVLSNKKYAWTKNGDTMVSFDETMEFIEQFLGSDINSIKISRSDIEKSTFTNVIKNIISNNDKQIIHRIPRHNLRQSLCIPSEYFIERGFSKEILDKYDVGLCDKPDKEMYNRAVVPIYDIEHKYMVGCTGRSVFKKCMNCDHYHDQNRGCPDKDELWRYSKWKHNKDFKSQNHLYNMWFAKKHILDSGKVILVESPGNVWKLEEAGINNSVALFGANLSDRQKILLDGSGAMTIIVIMDNDDAGKKASISITNKCKNTYNIHNINISKPDIGEMTLEEINKEIKPYI